MLGKSLRLTAVTAVLFAPLAAWSQTNQNQQMQKNPGSTASDKDSPKMQQPGEIQKQTDAAKNGTTQSESLSGKDKNGQPQK